MNTSGVSMPRHPIRSGFVFMGWYPNADGTGTRFTAQRRVDYDMYVYARWLPYIRVTINGNRGNPTETVRNIPVGYTFFGMSNIWSSTNSGFEAPGYMNTWYDMFTLQNNISWGFSTWPMSPALPFNTMPCGFGTPFGGSTPVWDSGDGTLTVYVQWIFNLMFNSNRTQNPNIPGTDTTMQRAMTPGRTINDNHLHPHTANTVHQWPTPQNWSSGLTAPGTGWHVAGWNTQRDGSGIWYTPDTVVNGPRTLFAVWTRYMIFSSGFAPDNLILYENRERHVLRGYTIANSYCGYGMPPDPEPWPGQYFRGWSTSSDGTWDGPGRPAATIGPGSVVENPFVVFATWYTTLRFDG
jgi:uncharacterized repeat protein (TIGR02543 family)